MSTARQILVVSQNARLTHTLVSWLSAAAYELSVVTTFAAAKAHLSTAPDLIITEVKLQEYNGLHLALRARAAGIPTIVIGPDDLVLAKDAFELGASYLNRLPSCAQLMTLVEEVLCARENATAAQAPGVAVDHNNLLWNYFGGTRVSPPLGHSGRRALLH